MRTLNGDGVGSPVRKQVGGNLGIRRVLATQVPFHHAEKDVNLVVHGDDFMFTGGFVVPKWAEELMIHGSSNAIGIFACEGKPAEVRFQVRSISFSDIHSEESQEMASSQHYSQALHPWDDRCCDAGFSVTDWGHADLSGRIKNQTRQREDTDGQGRQVRETKTLPLPPSPTCASGAPLQTGRGPFPLLLSGAQKLDA